MDDFSQLNETRHMLEWLAADPEEVIRSEFERWLDHQVPGSRLNYLRAVSRPQWLTGARPSEDDPGHAVLVRTGVAFEFDLSVSDPNGQQDQLQGVFTWVGVHLDAPHAAKQRMWFDVGGTLVSFGSDGELASRLQFA